MAYINDVWDSLPPENREKCRKAMAKYKNNRWWESDNPIEVAMYQVFEDILLVDFSKFHEGLEKLLDRPVFTHEMGLNIKGIREEAKYGIGRLKTGNGVSDEYRETAVKKSIEMLEDYCKRTGKKLIKFEIPKRNRLKNASNEFNKRLHSYSQEVRPYRPDPAVKDKTYEIQSEEQGKVKKLLTQAYSPSSNKEAVADKANELFEKLYEAGTNGTKTKKIKKRIRKFAEKMNYDKEFGLDKKTLEERIKYKI